MPRCNEHILFHWWAFGNRFCDWFHWIFSTHILISGFPEILVCLILRDVLLGIDYLHGRGFIHRSIRASHILINQSKAILCGFRETSALITHGQRTRLLFDLPPHSTKSLNWLAPEVLEQNLSGYSEKSDVYSIGITTCELANGLEPFSKMPTTFMLTEKMRGNQPALLDCSTCPDDVIGEQNHSSPFISTRIPFQIGLYNS